MILVVLTHWGRVTHICVGKLSIIDSDNGLSPGRRQAIIWTKAGILWIGPLGTNFSEILIEIQTFSLKKIRFKMSSAKCCPFRLGLNVLSEMQYAIHTNFNHRWSDKPKWPLFSKHFRMHFWRQAIILTNDDNFIDEYMHHSASMS